MKRYAHNEKGFTLIEMLFVLFIVVLLSSVVFRISIKVSEKQVVDQFFQQLQLDIQQTQALAIKNKASMDMTFVDLNMYYIRNTYGKYIVQRSFPPGIQINTYSNMRTIYFNPNGEVSDFGKIGFNTPFGRKEIVVNIYKGRVRYVE